MKAITQIQFAPAMPKRKRTAAYTRVSSGKEAMLHSLSAQVSYYSGLIQKRADWEYAGVYIDEAVSGTKDSRAEFQRMLDDCRAGKIDQVITKSITRFARNTVTLLKTVRELKALGIDVFFEEQNIHTQSSEGEMVLAILAAHAQENSLRVSESCKWRIRDKYAHGIPTGCIVFGYQLERGVFTIIPAEAAIVKKLFMDYLAGMGIGALSRKHGFSTTAVRQMLRNEKYAGDLLLQKSYVTDHLSKRKVKNIGQLPQYLVRGNHPAIVDRGIFDAVQTEISRRAAIHQPNPRAPQSYPLTGLIRCGLCGAAYHRKHANAGGKYEKVVWICHAYNTLGKTVCANQQIPEDILLAKTEEAGGFKGLEQITAAGPGMLSFKYTGKDERVVDLTWQNPSRRESWTPEMKEAARQKSLAAAQKRREQEANP